jgi:hypothetical protein
MSASPSCSPTLPAYRTPIYDAASDHWSAPIADRGLMLYAVVPDAATVIVLRLIAL